ncbi:MAG TPA: HAMP domain-containing sensor histidine kinase, partial [Vicinamibacterales bacterium]|nr:HAMP domain-containing sensor histidine kinase [Vicinamibacterales bacterium]
MYRPRSIASLLLIGFATILTPLIAAVVTAVVQVDRLAAQSRAAVLEAAVTTQQSRGLVESLSDMRRPFLQYQATGDTDFYSIYVERRTAFLTSLRNLPQRNLTARGKEHLDDLARREQALFEVFGTAPATAQAAATTALADAERAWTELNDVARSILAENSSFIEAQVNYTTQKANELQRTLLIQAAAVIPGTIVLAALFIVLITRPMREIVKAIRRLGAQQLAESIEVSGPRDVEELGKLLDWLRRRIQQLEHQKMTFLRHISHELKTPLTTIREGSALLSEVLADAPDDAAEIARIIHTNGLHLQKLIEDLLRFSETQDVATELTVSERVDLRALVLSVTSALALAAGAKGIDVVTDLKPTAIRGDENKIRIVIENLLTNATKYTPPGGRISIALRRTDDRVILDVRDTGPGVDDADAEKIFEPFQQGTAECTASVKGTGLGLSIAKEYV